MPARPSEVDPTWGDVQEPRRDIVTITFKENGVQLPVHKDVAATLIYVLRSAWAGGYQSWHKGNTWGLSVRTVRGRDDVWSSHAYGTAVDVSSDKNPMRVPLTTDMPDWLPELFKAWGFRWGGDWTRRPDPMHFSNRTTRQEAQAINAKAGPLILAGRWGRKPDGSPSLGYPISESEEEEMVQEIIGLHEAYFGLRPGTAAWNKDVIASFNYHLKRLIRGEKTLDQIRAEFAKTAKVE